jgi:hypothetical protein
MDKDGMPAEKPSANKKEEGGELAVSSTLSMEGMAMFRRKLATGLITLGACFAWIVSAEAAHHGGGHGGGFHHGGGHGGGFHHGGFHSAGFHHSGFHRAGFNHAGFHHAGFHHGGFHHGGFHHGFHHHGFHHGFHRNFFFSSYWPFYGSYWWPYYYGSYYWPRYYSYPDYYYPYSYSYLPYTLTSPYDYYGAPDDSIEPGPYIDPVTTAIRPVLRQPAAREVIPYGEDGDEGTYRYDGDPANVVPPRVIVPQKRVEPPAPKAVPDVRYVSKPAKQKKYTYRAYGEKPAALPDDAAGTLVTRKPRS